MGYVSHIYTELFAAPWTVPGQAPLSWDSPGKNTEVGCHALLRGSSQPRDQTCVSYVFCTGSRFFTASEKKIQVGNNNRRLFDGMHTHIHRQTHIHGRSLS